MKKILITGSTDGIGKLAAIQLAKKGHTVYIHGRNQEKVNACISEIKLLSNNKNIGGFVADFSDLSAVKQMAEDVKRHMAELDVLVNNAGIYNSRDKLSKQGYELRFVVNYLAPYILTQQLLPLLKGGIDSRIINLSSAAQSEISFDAFIGKQNISVNEAYAQSKLALTMWSFYLATTLDDIGVIAVNPGSLLNTKMVIEAFGQHWSPANKGSDIICDLALGENHKGITGKYFDNDRGVYGQAHTNAYNQEAIKRLIEFSESLVF